MPRPAAIPDTGEEGRLALSAEAISWEAGAADPVLVAVYTTGEWRVAGAPWWVEARREGTSLLVRPTTAGPLSGTLVVRGGGRRAVVALAAPPTAARGGPWLARVVVAFAVAGAGAHYVSSALPEGGPPSTQLAVGILVPGVAVGLALGLAVGGWRLVAKAILGALLGFGAALLVARQLAFLHQVSGLGALVFPWSYLAIGALAYGAFGLVAGWVLAGHRLAGVSAWRAIVAGLVGVGVSMALTRMGMGWVLGPVLIPAGLWGLAISWMFPPAGSLPAPDG